MVTAEQVREWRRLADAATPGEWELRHPVRRGTYKVRYTDGDGVHWYIVQNVPFGEDAAFIAAARAAVPALCDALEAAWAERDALAAELASYQRGAAAIAAAVDEYGRYVP